MMSSLTAESWTWYAVCWTIVLVRLLSKRVLHGSVKRLQIDDGLMILAMITDTVLIAAMNIVAVTNTNLINPNAPLDLTPEAIQERIYGSKMVLVVEQMQIVTIWLVKACLLIMYGRLTMSLKQNLAVKIVAGYVAFGFVFMEIFYLGVWCRPFYKYWAVPSDNVQCTAATNHLITNAVLNISSDIMILLIPLPLLIQAHLPLKRKAILVTVFALGAFTILSAVLNKYYSFTQPFGVLWTFWYIRESSTAIITANVPFTWALIRRVFNLSSFERTHTTTNVRSNFVPRSDYHHFDSGGNSEGGDMNDNNNRLRVDPITGLKQDGLPLRIYQQHDIQISSHTITEDVREITSPELKMPERAALPRRNYDDSDKASISDRSTVGIITVCRRD